MEISIIKSFNLWFFFDNLQESGHKHSNAHTKRICGVYVYLWHQIFFCYNFTITWQLCAQKFLMICCSFNWLSGIRFYQECKKLKCWLLTYWDHICIISFGIIDCCKHEKNRPNIGAVSNVWLRRSGETYKTWYPIILRQTCSSLARQCKIGG